MIAHLAARFWRVPALAAVAVACGGGSTDPEGVDLTGTWRGRGTWPGSNDAIGISFTVQLRQTGDSLHGTGSVAGTAPLPIPMTVIGSVTPARKVVLAMNPSGDPGQGFAFIGTASDDRRGSPMTGQLTGAFTYNDAILTRQ